MVVAASLSQETIISIGRGERSGCGFSSAITAVAAPVFAVGVNLAGKAMS
jgi:hypothetical protein